MVFDISVNRFYKISDPENHGKPGMMALAQVENKHILVGKDLMKDNEDKNGTLSGKRMVRSLSPEATI